MGDARDEQILDAATQVFLRYGFKRTTMGDLAEAAGLSRPALYLRYCGKTHLFEAAFRRFSGRIQEEIREGLRGIPEPLEQLRLAFELWVVRPWQLVREMPDARELADGFPGLASEVAEEGQRAFEEILQGILKAMGAPPPGMDPARLAHLLASTARGLKATARSEEDLRSMVEDLIQMVQAGLPRPE